MRRPTHRRLKKPSVRIIVHGGHSSSTAASTAATAMKTLTRVPSCARLRRISSAPTLLPVFEPNEGEEAAEQAAVIAVETMDARPYLRSVASEKHMADGLLAFLQPTPDRQSHRQSHSHAALPLKWDGIVHDLQSHCGSLSPAQQAELVMAVQESLCHSGQLQLRSGRVDDRFLIRREVLSSRSSSGNLHQILEAVDRSSDKNYSLKVVHNPLRLRAPSGKSCPKVEPLQAFYLICSFVEEVFVEEEHGRPTVLSVVMRWGMHEVDASDQLSSLIFESLKLILEILPADQTACRNLQIGGADLQSLLLRSMALDTFLQSNLFLE